MKSFKLFLCFIVVGLMMTGIGLAEGKVVAEDVMYELDGVQMKGYLAVDNALKGKRPGVLIIHQWKGLGEYEKRRARQLAKMGYVAFAADIYGADTRPSTNHEAALASSTFRNDRNRYRERIQVAVDLLRNRDRVKPDDIAAIGYCFGGTGVLELARSGADVDAVVSFHGGLTNPNPDDVKNIKAIVQVHHGAKDPHVTQEHVTQFWSNMQEAPADWDLHIYSNAVHGFTEKEAGDAYNARADRLSWNAMSRLFEDVFNE